MLESVSMPSPVSLVLGVVAALALVSCGQSGGTSGSSGSTGASAAAGAPGKAGSGGGAAAGGFAGAGHGGTGGSGSSGANGGISGTAGTDGGGSAAAGAVSGGTSGASGSSAAAGAVGTAGVMGTSGGAGSASCSTVPASASDVVVNVALFEQTMDGFGVCNAYQSSPLTDAMADQFFSESKGIGLSIFRLGIKPDGTSWGPIADAKKAADRGASVWAAPWTPPANCKSNNSLTNGGHLNKSCYESWASTLAAFPGKAKQAGVTVFGISVQNESDNATAYESCIYSGQEMVDFIKVLGPKLKALNPPVKLLGPESTRWEHLWGPEYDYGNLILADPAAAAQVDILATHMYETATAVAPPPGVTKPIWQTEMSGVMGFQEAGPSSDIKNGVVVATWIHDAITVGHASSWHSWWITSLNDDNEGLLLKGGGTTKRLYTVGNYSKFIRPGYRRVQVSGPVPASVKLTAYVNSADATTVIVAINSGTSAVSLPLYLAGSARCPMTFTPWVTSVNDDLATKPAVSASDAHLSPVLAAQSVTTFVGKP